MLVPTRYVPRGFPDPGGIVNVATEGGKGVVDQATTQAPDVVNTVTDKGKDIATTATDAAMSVKDKGEVSFPTLACDGDIQDIRR